MSIDYLKAVISPPQNVVDRPSEGDWAGVEARLGTVLPDDYKDFLREYGSGSIGQFLWIFNPFSKNENLNLERQAGLQAAVLRELSSYGEIIPYKIFPEGGGIMPFGITDNGDVLFGKLTGFPILGLWLSMRHVRLSGKSFRFR